MQSTAILDELRNSALQSRPIKASLALAVLEDESLKLQDLVALAALARKRYFGRRIRLHVINNLRNGHCPEDCCYCAQRRGSKAGSIFQYADKSEEEILAEARRAWESGAYRYCLVSAGRGPTTRSLHYYARLVQKIKERYPLQVCLSAGLLRNAEDASILARAGLDRYNHNLNTSREYYPRICSSHTYEDRRDTLNFLQDSGIALCSGLIAGMGELSRDLVQVALELQKYKVASIPVNFFLALPGHAVKETQNSQAPLLKAERCLRILSMLRLTNPKAEIRMAAGRELYLKERQKEAFAVANSLFVSGYLNVKGSSAAQTIALIKAAGYEIETHCFQNIEETEEAKISISKIQMKGKRELRPFRAEGP